MAQWRDAFASCLQETWRPQDHEELCDLEGGHTFIGVGQAHNSAGRGSQGVGILLSPSATRAWHLAKTRYARSHLVNDLGPRVLAVTLTLQETATKRAADVFLISAYAPTSAHSEDDWDAYYDSLSAALARCPPKAIAIIGSDANACIGTGEGERNDEKFDEGYEVVGRFGSTRVNDSGRRLRVYLETHQLCALTSFFPKKHYTTWTHPCSRLGYQLDYFFVFRQDLRRFRDAGSMAGQLIDSDHRALRASLDCKEPKKKKLIRDARQTLSRLDHTRLQSQEGKDSLVQHTLTVLATRSTPSDNHYDCLASALYTAAEKLLPRRARSDPQWFQKNALILRGKIEARNKMFDASTNAIRVALI